MARELANRAGDRCPRYSNKDRLTGCDETTKALYLARRTFPPAKEKLEKAQPATLRVTLEI
ncbi:hypothetical protein HPB50_000386 [Hyalomma asiaticum]|uniref:Uncharacterized protein n=1 Tax=Hyalomma asiaticum TaxID=266040 RepID=A0ACB7SDJ6_HYAAI|nr:hypothetical protein HPB50_000386 [Hyalomma asiaticum]